VSLRPLDKLFRSTISFRPLGGFLSSDANKHVRQQEAFLQLSLSSKDKTTAPLFLPAATRTYRKDTHRPHAMCQLDLTDAASLNPAAAAFSTPGLDLDPMFVHKK